MPEPLTLDAIVDAALALAHEVGVARLTMRSLGDRLGVTAMAVYHYIPTKDVLLQQMANRLIAEVPLPAPAGGDWAPQLASLLRGIRTALEKYPGLGASLLGTDVPTPAMDRITLASIATITGQGFSETEAALAFTAMHNFLLGRLNVEDAFGRSSDALRRRLGEQGPRPMPRLPAEEHFEYGLSVLIDGIRARHP